MTERDDVPLHAGYEPALDGDLAVAIPPEPAAPEDEPAPVPSRGGCKTELRGWAGAHLHGAVRPRRRATGRRGRPPGRWC